MKNSILKLIVGLLLVCFLASGASAVIKYEQPIKILYAKPSQDSAIVFEIPVEVTVLGIMEDLNWFRVRIQFAFFDYTGWVNIPVGNTFNVKIAPENIP